MLIRTRTQWLWPFLGLSLFFLLTFALVEALEVPYLSESWWGRSPAPTVALGFLLLVADALLPVPSSVVMVAAGHILGAPLGALVAWAGTVGASLVAYGLGRGGARIMPNRQPLVWGPLAVLLTRPVPVLAESVAVVAGIHRMPMGQFLASAMIGAIPAAVVYAYIGATATSPQSLGLVIAGAIMVGALLWWLGQRFLVPAARDDAQSKPPSGAS